jgi:DNA-binding transcriptional LysR family regulator
VLDACFHVIRGFKSIISEDSDAVLALPFAVGRVVFFRAPGEALLSRATAIIETPTEIVADISILNDAGDVVALSTFLSARPHVNLSLMGRSSPEVVELVESGKADIGFVYDAAVASDELTSIPLFDDEMCLIACQDNAVEDCIDLTVTPLRLVGFPEGYALRRMLECGGMRLEFVAEAETVDAMLRLVASGVGPCILPSRMPDNIISDYKLKKIRILKPSMRRRVVAVVRAGRHPTGLIKELLETAVAKVP